MRRTACASALAISLVALGAACANGTTSPDDPGRPTQDDSATVTDDLSTLDAFCAAVGRAACSDAVVKRCGLPSPAACQKARAAACTRTVPQGTTYVAKNATACVSAIKVADLDGTLTGDELSAIDEACGPPVFAGPGDARAPCTSPYDCRSDLGLDCVVPWDATTKQGKCMKPNVVPMGKTCAGEADVCSDDAYCEAASHTCKARAIVGEACANGYTPCARGATCPGAGPFGQTCKALKAAGDPCADASECASNLCDKAKGQAAGNCADSIEFNSLDSVCADFSDDPGGGL